MGAAAITHTIFGVIGNITSFFLFGSPIPTFYRICKKKSVEEFKPDPYIAAVMNCVFWVFYGLPVVHPNSTLVVTINSLGLLLELIYLLIFLIYSDNKQRWKIFLWLLGEAVVFAAIACVTILEFHTHDKRIMFVGIFCVVFGVVLYSSPLTIMKKVINTKSVEFMPFWLSMAAFSNGVIWLIYACIYFDPYIFTSNGLGALLGAAQLILYAKYYKSTPKGDAKKPPEVQLSSV